MPEEVDSELDQHGPGTCRMTSKPGPEMAEPPSKSKGKAGKGSKRAKVDPQASSKGTKKMDQKVENVDPPNCLKRHWRTSAPVSKRRKANFLTLMTALHAFTAHACFEKHSLMVKLLTAQTIREALKSL